MAHRMNARSMIGTFILLAVTPLAANAQFGMLKKLKNSISPDSAAKVEAAKEDSIALAAKIAAGDTTPLQRSKFQRAVTAAGAASDKFESVTGVSAKDAALAATGVGASGLIAKKMGVDPMSLGAKALNMGQGQKGTGGVTGGVQAALRGMPGMPSIPGMPNMADLMKMQQSAAASAVQLQGAAKLSAGKNVVAGNPYAGIAGLSEADAKAIAAFQQDMMQTAMAASGGDAAAQARLERWQAIALKYEPEIQKLSASASGGDMAALQRLQLIQVDIIKEWANTGSAKTANIINKAIKPVKATKP
jgi:hypothetical protein